MSMISRGLMLLLAVVLLSTSCKSTKEVPKKVEGHTDKTSAVHWRVGNAELDGLLREAQAKDKILLLDFYADWCLPCKMMDQDVFTDQDIGDYLNETFIPIKINGDKDPGRKIANQYLVAGFPTLLWLRPDGTEIIRQEGAVYHSKLRALSQQALTLYQSQNDGQ